MMCIAFESLVINWSNKLDLNQETLFYYIGIINTILISFMFMFCK